MGAPANPASPAPEWEYLVAHHQPDRYSRTLGLHWRGRTVHFCARCTGQALGLVAYGTAFVLLAGWYPGWFSTPGQYLFAVLPLPAALDWLAQSVGRRESNNGVRLGTGLLLGIAYADLIALLVTGRWAFLLDGFAVFGLYLASIAVVLRVTGAWRRVVEEHFPGLTLETSG